MNDRELATAIWIAALLVLVLWKRDLRASLWDVIKLFLGAKILVPVLFYATVIGARVFVAAHVGLWNQALLAETLIWFFLSGAVLFFRVTDAGKDQGFFRKRVLETVGIAAFLEFFMNLKTMALPWELLLQPVVAVLVGLQVVAGSDRKHAPVKRLANGLLALVGIGLLAFTIQSVATYWRTQDYQLFWRCLALPIWLTLGVLPFIYSLALSAGYEQVLTRMSFFNDRQRPHLRAVLGVVVGLRGNLSDVNGFAGPRARAAAVAGSFEEARREVAGFKQDRQQERDRQQAKRERMVRYAGVDGTDDSGRRLDRREFEATKRALEWLATCQMGWFRQRASYRADLLGIVGHFDRQGLPQHHGITMHVRKDGHAWYAYRRTISGWVLGIGAGAPPPNQWHYDSAEPPSGYPGEDPGWGDIPFITPPNWRGGAAARPRAGSSPPDGSG